MITSGQVSENTLQLNQSGGGRIDIPLPESEPNFVIMEIYRGYCVNAIGIADSNNVSYASGNVNRITLDIEDYSSGNIQSVYFKDNVKFGDAQANVVNYECNYYANINGIAFINDKSSSMTSGRIKYVKSSNNAIGERKFIFNDNSRISVGLGIQSVNMKYIIYCVEANGFILEDDDSYTIVETEAGVSSYLSVNISGKHGYGTGTPNPITNYLLIPYIE